MYVADNTEITELLLFLVYYCNFFLYYNT